MSLIWVSRVDVLLMSRLLPEHPYGSSRVTAGKLLSSLQVSSWFLLGCSVALLDPVARPPRLLLVYPIHGPPLGGARPEISVCNCCVSISLIQPGLGCNVFLSRRLKESTFHCMAEVIFCTSRINTEKIVLCRHLLRWAMLLFRLTRSSMSECLNQSALC